MLEKPVEAVAESVDLGVLGLGVLSTSEPLLALALTPTLALGTVTVANLVVVSLVVEVESISRPSVAVSTSDSSDDEG